MTAPSSAGLSVTFWAYRDSTSNYMYLMDDRNTADGDARMYLYLETGANTLTKYSGFGTLYVDGISGATSATPNAWHHFAITGLTTFDTSGTLNFGQNWASAFRFNGKFDQIKIFDRTLTPAQIAWDYNKGGPVAHWRFDECQWTTANDSSGNTNTGTITVGATGTYTSMGTCPVSSASTMWYNGATGKRNYSLAFDGTDDYVTMGDPASGVLDFGTGDFSLSAWIK